jgi:hypothetical protein
MWIISKNGNNSEPMTEEKVREMIKSGELLGEDLAKNEEMSDWIPLKNFKIFQNHFFPEKDNISLGQTLAEMIYSSAWFGWFLSLLGFLICWLVLDVGEPSLFGNGTVNLHRMSIKSNGMMAFGVFLIVISMYLIAYKILDALTRIEKALSEKMKEEA